MTNYLIDKEIPKTIFYFINQLTRAFIARIFFIIGILKIKTATYFIYKAIKS
jgi:hypothetical protein